MREIPTAESLTVEFKSDRKRLPDNDLVEAVVGMANAEGGEIFLGVEDDGTPTGLHKEHTFLDGLSGLVANRTSPPVPVTVKVIDMQGMLIGRISVPKMPSIVATSAGTIKRRLIGSDGKPENVPFLPHEHMTRLSDLGIQDATRQIIPQASLSDLDPAERLRLRQFVEQNHGDSALLPLSDAEMDSALGLVSRTGSSLTPTLLGLLLIGKEESLRRLVPTHEVALQVLDGEAVRINVFHHSPLLRIVEWLNATFVPLNPEEEVQLGLFRIGVPKVDTRAFREAVANALTHRDFTKVGAVHVRMESDALTVSNPGGFVEGVTLSNLLTTEPRPRNPALADAFKRLGLVERTGRGVDLIYRGLLRYGRAKPDYTRSNAAGVVLRMSTSRTDLALLKMILNEENRTQTALPVDSLIALSMLREQRRITRGDLAGWIQKDEESAGRTLEALKESGLIQAHGQTRGRSYTLSPAVYAELGESSEYIHQAGFNRIQQEQMVVNYVKANDRITREAVMTLCRLSGNDASRLLKSMTENGLLERQGKGRWTYYELREH